MLHYPNDILQDIYAGDNWMYELGLHLGDLASFNINDGTWIREDQTISLQTTDGVFGGGCPCIGSVVSRQLTAKIYVGYYTENPSVVSTGPSRVFIAWRCHGTDITVSTFSAWHLFGAWHVTKKQYDPVTGVLTITAFDALADTDSRYLRIHESAGTLDPGRHCYVNGATTATATDLLNDIAGILGVDVDSDSMTRLAGFGTLTLDRPDDETTMREILQWIAGACGCNIRLTWDESLANPDGVLVLVPFQRKLHTTEQSELSTRYQSITFGSASNTSAYWDVCLTGGQDGADHLSTHNDGDIATVRFEMDNPFGSDGLCDQILASIREQSSQESGLDWFYRGFTAQNALLDMRAEAGDLVTVDVPQIGGGGTDTYALIVGAIVRTWDVACAATVSAPEMSKREIDPYEGTWY